jgi:RNA polymerase sigma factor (sigma-70 family)
MGVTQEHVMERDQLMTRRTLVNRLKDCEDEQGWREFFETYWRLIYGTARKTGLTSSEAEEVVQETVITVARKMSEFEYDPARCSFKGWLLRITQFKILDQLRKRPPSFIQHSSPDRTDTRTDAVERVPDPKAEQLEGIFEEEWRNNVFQAALNRVKRRVNPKHFQMFYLNMVEQMGIREIARAMRVNPAVVYMAKSRVARAVQKEIARMERI